MEKNLSTTETIAVSQDCPKFLGLPVTPGSQRVKEPSSSLKITKFKMSSRGPRLWNKILDNNTKAFTSRFLFQKTVKNRLIILENLVSFF